MPIPLVSAFPSKPMRVNFNYRVIDGMYRLTGSRTGYAASPNGCSSGGGGGGGNTSAHCNPSSSTGHAAWGDPVSLLGNFTDPDPQGDTHTYSWTQIQDQHRTHVEPSNPTQRNTSIIAPNVDVTLRYRFKVTDSANASDSEDIVILVSQQGGGGRRRRRLRWIRIRHLRGDRFRMRLREWPAAVATVPVTYIISEGFQGEIQATNAMIRMTL